MKLLLVFSQVNYMPDNYNGILKGLISALSCDQSQNEQKSNKVQIVGCASLKTLDSSLITSIVKLPLIGVFNLPKQLSRNILSAFKDERQKICQNNSITHLKWQSMNTKEAKDWVNENEIDLIINLRTRCIYKSEILEAPKLGCINIHHGILPKYRGTFCDLYALFENRPAGFSIHKMAKKVDAGDIYVTKVVDTGAEKNYSRYLERTIPEEVKSLELFLKSCSAINPPQLPKAQENCDEKPHYTQNPTPSKIRLFKKEGMTL